MHLIYRFATGGLENGLINLVNTLPPDVARHRIIALVGVDKSYAARITTTNCQIEDLGGKADQQSLRLLPAVYRRLRALKPALVHTRNLSTLECQFAAWFARIPTRIHGEHGWDESDQYGSNTRYTLLRRLSRHFIHCQIALSKRTATYLTETVGVPPSRIQEIQNGVDTQRFGPDPFSTTKPVPAGWPFLEDSFVLGTVGRLSGVKNQLLLCKAFLQLRERSQQFRHLGRLVLVGDGPDRSDLEQFLASKNAREAVWFAGDRRDIPELLRRFELFVLPSKAEGLSNSILEAMASGLPIVATNVGGNCEQIDDGVTGTLTDSGDVSAMAAAIEKYFLDDQLRQNHAQAARERAINDFSLQSMAAAYQNLYARFLYPSSDSNSQLYQPERLN